MNIQEIIAMRIKTARLALGWSQEELAERSGLHRTYISGLERSTRNPTVTVLSKIADALGVTVSALTAAP